MVPTETVVYEEDRPLKRRLYALRHSHTCSFVSNRAAAGVWLDRTGARHTAVTKAVGKHKETRISPEAIEQRDDFAGCSVEPMPSL